MKIKNPHENREVVEALLRGKKCHEEVTIECCGCGNSFDRDKSRVLVALKHNTDMYCSSKCFNFHRTSKVVLNCEICNKEVTRTPAAISPHIYCSTKCSRKANNNRLGTGTAILKQEFCGCGNKKYTGSEMCQKCRNQEQSSAKIESLSKKTFRMYKAECNAESYRYYNRMRMDSRYLAENLFKKQKVCVHCGYDFHVELCHIRPISDFPETATLLEINAPSNAVYLCPNHHKELDKGRIAPEAKWFI